MPSIAQPGFRKLSRGQPPLPSTISPSFHFSAQTTSTTIFFLYLSTLYPPSAGGCARLGCELLPGLKPGQVLPAHAGVKTPASLLGHDPSPSSVTIQPSSSVTIRLPPRSRSSFLPRQAFPSHSEADRLFSYLHCFCLLTTPFKFTTPTGRESRKATLFSTCKEKRKCIQSRGRKESSFRQSARCCTVWPARILLR
jgi:hypothetical protein